MRPSISLASALVLSCTAILFAPQCLRAGEDGPPLAEGQVDLAASQWHRLELGMNGDQITVRIDRSTLATLHDSTHSHGQVGLGCGLGGNQFESFSILPNGDLLSE